MERDLASLRDWAASHITWYGQAAFRLRTEAGQAIFIDPFRVPRRAGPADLILVTHPHFDHYDRKAIARLRTTETPVVLPRSCAGSGEIGMYAGESLSFGKARVTGISAYNLEKKYHPKPSAWLGYLIEVDGLRIYHAGDTDRIPEMRGLKPGIALIPIGGSFGMDASEALDAVDLMQATLAIPMHFGLFLILLGGPCAGRRFAARLGDRGLALPRSRA